MTRSEHDLSTLFEDAVADVDPAERLTAIRAATASQVRTARTRRWTWTGGAVLATAAAVVVALALGSGDPSGGRAEDPSGPATEPEVTVSVYRAGDSPEGFRLYRELRQVPGADPLLEAARLAVSPDSLDPDYIASLPEYDVESVSESDGYLVVEVADAEATYTGDAPDRGSIPMQALVYTLQRAAGSDDPVKVVTSDGEPVTVLGVDTTDGVDAEPPLDVLAHVNVASPEQGETVSGTFTASGLGSSFEATIGWRIEDPDGRTVLEYSTMAEGWEGRLYPWSTEIDVSDLAPGDYTFVAFTDDPTGGEGPGPYTDSKDIVVE